jgi:hypothetical protein
LEKEHDIPGAGVSFNLWGQREEEPMAIGFQSPEVRSMNGYVQVERALNDKASKYPEITAAGIPYVVALCSGSWFAIDEEQVLSGVYGTRQITFYVPRGPVVGPVPPPTEARRGGMLAQRSDTDFNNREVSAVLYVWEDLTSTDRPLRAKVFHHPEPLVVLPRSAFSHVPQTEFQRQDDERVTIEFSKAPTQFELD